MLVRLAFIACLGTLLLWLLAPHARADDADFAVLFWGSETAVGRFGSNVGFKLAPIGGLDRSGPVVMGLANADVDVETLDGGAFDAPGEVWTSMRGTMSGAVLLGWQWTAPWGSTFVAAGPQAARAQVRLPDASVVWGDTTWGASGLVEVWAHPRPGWLATATLIGSSATPSVWSRAALGIGIGDVPGLSATRFLAHAFARAYFGPEAVVYADDGYAEARVGVHLTGLRVGALSMRLGGGFAFGDAEGPYLTLSTHTTM